MDEYVRVGFPTKRKVRVDGQSAGFTNKVLQVETGRHTFDLGKKKNYNPDKIERDVQGTRPSHPLELSFKRTDRG